MGDDDPGIKSINLKFGTHYFSSLEPRASFLFFDLGTLDRQSFAFLAPWREYGVFSRSLLFPPWREDGLA